MITLLLDKNADVSAQYTHKEYGRHVTSTPLEWAAKEIVKYEIFNSTLREMPISHK